jgi:hypothetical protein
VGRATIDTLTNKTLTTPVISSLSSASATALTLQSAGTTAVTIDTSQNVGIGTTSPSDKFNVVGTTNREYARIESTFSSSGSEAGIRIKTAGTNGKEYLILNANTEGSLRFYDATAAAERMRIDTSGNLLVGTTSTSVTSGVGMKFIFSADTNNPVVKTVVQDASGAYSTWNLYSTNASAYRFFVTTAGIVNATTTTITAISDQRLKENIRDLDDGLEKVLALKPRKFDWKENKGENIKNARGFIAQELELVFPDMISNWIDEPPEGEEPYKAVNANLIPSLVKAIQEQQSLITALTARITALEST